MKITILMVITYILWCIRLGTKPCKYFQLNVPYFDRKVGIYSKIAIDQRIPARWRLEQFYDDGVREPNRYPVFVKPEWGQNAKGILKANNARELDDARKKIADERVRYLLQEGAIEQREFEIFALRDYANQQTYSVFTITEAVNTSESSPINSVHNRNTQYIEITDQFSEQDKQQLWKYVGEIGSFNISRTSVRSNSLAELLDGRFHVIEINLFLPMPINMLDHKYDWSDLRRMIRHYMFCLAKITWARDKTQEAKPVFTKIMLYDRRSKILNYLRSKI
ncbi:MAG: hypothetical protein GKR96_12945 [Gammaproteobacteria bacterium]|nr:hypothetical protein [Gammaproteobacteria bacterium]